MKIGFRLLLWYLSTALVAMTFFSTTTYFGSRHLMFQALAKERDSIVKAIESHFDPVTGTFRDLAAEHFYINLDMEESYLVIYDAGGQPIYRSPMAEQITLSVPLATDEPEVVTIITQSMEKMPVFHAGVSGNVRFQAASRKLFHEGRLIGWLNVASSMDDLDHALRDMMKALFGAKVVVLAVLLSGGYLITRRSLRPVAVMTAQARRISSTRLSERIKVADPSDEIGQLAIVLNDLLDRLERAFTSQQQFIADAAHELKTPFAILRTHWEDELNNPELSEKYKEKLVGDMETITRLSRVINDLLFLAHTESTAANLEFGTVRLDELARDVVDDTKVLAEMKQQQLMCGSLDPASVIGDRDRLYQVAFNLIDNAVKYSDEGGRITVAVSKKGEFVELDVHDDGPGIPEADQPHIFDCFYRVSKDRSRKTGGSGLGLAICKMITEAHGGKISIQCKPGEGNSFCVRLPVGHVA